MGGRWYMPKGPSEGEVGRPHDEGSIGELEGEREI